MASFFTIFNYTQYKYPKIPLFCCFSGPLDLTLGPENKKYQNTRPNRNISNFNKYR